MDAAMDSCDQMPRAAMLRREYSFITKIATIKRAADTAARLLVMHLAARSN